VNADADASEHDSRLSVDCKGAVKIGEFSRGRTSRVRVKALDHDFKPDAVLIPVGILVPVWGALENAWNGDLLDTIPAALHHAQSMKWNGNHPVVRFIDRIYEKGIRLGDAAMRALEERLERLPGLEKWFVDIAPVPA
jgi:DDE family transposase